MTTTLTKQQADVLRSYAQRISGLEEQKKAIASEIAEEWKALKDSGFDVKAVKEAVRRLKLKEKDEQVTVYQLALDLTPLEIACEAA